MNTQEVEQAYYKTQERLSKEFGISKNFKYKAIGYLDITEKYQKGPVSQNFINKLKLIWDEGGVTMTLGFHNCEFCIDERNYQNKATSSCEKTIIDKENNIKYICPEMIFNYIEKHEYYPPKEFVLFCLNYKSPGFIK